MPLHKLSAFVQSGSSRVKALPTCSDFSYSDGDAIEDRLLSIVSKAADISLFSKELRNAISDWPSEYHLSPRRANIIRPLHGLGADHRVLELGCGCGAITRAIAETGATVDAVEGSFRRGSVAAERVRDLDNATVFVSNFQDIEFEPVYDVVTLIGVLEYAAVYVDSPDPFVECLNTAKSALKPGGILVIAIENQLGLKYFSGITEDHLSVPYYGIEGRYKARQVTTFGKRRLAAILEAAGFSQHSFLYPFPDYKLPEVILTEKAIRHPLFNAADLVAPLENRDYSTVGTAHFDLGLTWESIAAEGLLGELSNSFLVIAEHGQQSSLIRSNVLAQKFTDNRAPAFNTEVTFAEEGEEVWVNRTSLVSSPVRQHTSVADFSPEPEKYVFGRNALAILKRALITNDHETFKQTLQKWMEFVRSGATNGRWLDAIPSNVIVAPSGEFHSIDTEWNACIDFEWSLPVLRGLLQLASSASTTSFISGNSPEEKLQYLIEITNADFSESARRQAEHIGSVLFREVYESGIWNRDWRLEQQPVVAQSAASQGRSVVRAIAFHLPQFHAIPENDKWWGEGFTEWDNVKQGRPLFEGHYQPHVPGALGYYDLSDIAVLDRQARMARQYGIEGFCFYHYWFDGQRLLERPVDQLLQHPEINLPFCLCWANENWTRRWDGGEQEILIRQNHTPDNGERFARDLVPYMRDSRYIKVDSRPLLMIYRADIIPDLEETVAAWRNTWRKEGIGEVYIICVESFTTRIPQEHGFDAACEFLPHQVDFSQLRPAQALSHLTDHQTRIADYSKLADLLESRPQPIYKRFRGVVPSWDNSARRRKGGATLFTNATPERYEAWLRHVAQRTMIEFEGDERLVFINAWNEWGEGCHLEPDQKYGYAWLEATDRALTAATRVDVFYERNVRPYHEWLERHQLNHSDAISTASSLPIRFVIAVDASQSSLEDISGTLTSFAEQFYDHAQLIVASPFQAPTQKSNSILWLESQEFPNVFLHELAKPNPQVWLCRIRGGDRFAKSGLLLLAQMLQSNQTGGLVYADDDVLDPQYGPSSPQFRPDFDIDYLRSYPYIGRFIMMRGKEYLELDGFNTRYGSASFHDYVLRFFERYGNGAIFHLPEILFHGQPETDAEYHALCHSALISHFDRLGIAAATEPGLYPGSIRVRYEHNAAPFVSIIIPTKDKPELLQRCLESVLEKTTYQHYEILIIDNRSQDPEAIRYLAGLCELNESRIRVLSYPHDFNFSAINNLATQQARGEYLVLLNNDTAIVQSDWLENLLNHAQRPEVGIVGAKLLYPTGKVQHAGVVLGLRGPADHPFIGEDMWAPGYLGRLLVDQQYSAVTAACLMIRKSIYAGVSGMDEHALKVLYNDVDLCLKVREKGYSVVWTPHTILVHEGSVSQKSDVSTPQPEKVERAKREQTTMYERWMSKIVADPFYNRNLSLVGEGFTLEMDPLFSEPKTGLPNILAHPGDTTGSGNYRVILPQRALIAANMARGSIRDYMLDPVHLLKLDPEVVVMQMRYTDECLAALKHYREFSKAKLVYDIDDYLPNLPLASIHKGNMPKDILRRLHRIAELCDRVTVSTEALRVAFKELQSDIAVLPNFLPQALWGNISERPEPGNFNRKPRVGWIGGVSHRGDLALISEVVRALEGKVEWVFMGMLPEAALQSIAEFHPGIQIQDYPKYVASLDLDLALAPLEENLFNECKSNLRLLEYGACGYPVIATDIEPYRCGLPVTRVKNRFKSWMNAIEEKLADRHALFSEGRQLQDIIKKNWMLNGTNLDQWAAGWMIDTDHR